MGRVLEGLEPQSVFFYFEELTKIPRESRHEEAVAGYIAALAAGRGLAPIRDDAHNVVVNLPATPGYEHKKKLILQAHTDMVCQAADGVEFDFARQPIEPYIEGAFIRARNTTLGADDGFGVAMLLAIMTADDIPRPPLQLLFTAGEEVLFAGALALNSSLLEGEALIGLDSSRDDTIVVSCAGISINHLALPCRRQPLAGPGPKTVFRLRLSGLSGGHSGNMIHLGRANAIKVLGNVLAQLTEQTPARLLSLHSGGRVNVIATTATAAICCDSSAAPEVEAVLRTMAETAAAAYRRTDPGLVLAWKRCLPSPGETMVEEETAHKLLTLLALLPCGAHTMMDDAFSLAESSANIGMLEESSGGFRVSVSIRSNSEYQHDNLQRQLRRLAGLAGAGYLEENRSCAWEYKGHSALVSQVSRMYTQLNGVAPRQAMLHASVEAAVFVDKMKQRGLDLDAVNLGCNNYDPHTPAERLEITSVGKTYRLLLHVLRNLD